LMFDNCRRWIGGVQIEVTSSDSNSSRIKSSTVLLSRSPQFYRHVLFRFVITLALYQLPLVSRAMAATARTMV
jgi:hypothetical protein